MINRLYNYFKSNIYILYVILFSIMLIKHMSVQLGVGDDPWFFAQSQQGLLSYTQGRIQVWTSRNIIEAFMLILLNLPAYVWYITDSLMFVLIFHSIRKITKINISDSNVVLSIILFIILVLFPFDIFGTAGWYATTLNYVWPLAMGLYTLCYVQNMFDQIKPKSYEYVIVMFACIYASNQEQMCALVFGFSFLTIVYNVYKKRYLSPLVILIFFISIIMLGYHVLCPGNAARKLVETATYYPAYANFSLIDKITLGILSTISIGLVDPIYIVYIIVPILLYVAYKNQDKIYCYVLIFVTIINLFVSICDRFKSIYFCEKIYNIFYPYMYAVEKIDYLNWKVYVILIILVVNVALIIYPILKYMKDTKIYMIIILLAGLCTRFIIGFSASIFVSGIRTFIFMDFILIIIGLTLLMKLYNHNAD